MQTVYCHLNQVQDLEGMVLSGTGAECIIQIIRANSVVSLVLISLAITLLISFKPQFDSYCKAT